MIRELRTGRWSCVVDSEIGGSIRSLRLGGRDVLRPAPERSCDVLELASFPLAPFANRIEAATIVIEGKRFALSPDTIALPHAIHGQGWRRAWSVDADDSGSITLGYRHSGDEMWPWPYALSQKLSLEPDGLSVAFVVRNLDQARPMPFGSGLHPYFVRAGHCAVEAQAGATWTSDPDGLARERVESDLFRSGRPVSVDELEGVDAFFETDRAIVHLDGLSIALSGDAMAGMQVYVPAGETYFCVEPVSHRPNAFASLPSTSPYLLHPGETATHGWTLRALPREIKS